MALMSFREENHVKRVGVRPAHDGVQVWEYNEVTNGWVNIYIVPAGQTFYLTWYSFEIITLAAGSALLTISTAVPVSVIFLAGCIVVAGANTPNTVCSLAFPIEVPEGYRIRLNSAAAGLRVRGSIHGWVE